ncbi:hypothetical protein [Amycolatopsis thermoflava]|uniref:hypothetical protein n=1 Tax=Amycolatopsis thermoflava TaxID=84480 RepID=UPI003D70CD7C
MERRAALVAAVVAAAGLTACSTPHSDRPTPTTAAPTADPLEPLTACAVLDQLLAGQGFTPGRPIGVRDECGASKPGYGTVSVTLEQEQGEPEGAAPLDVNGRKALIGQFTGPGTCEVVLDVPGHAQAATTVVLLSADLQAEACAAAQDLAISLEPLLPR